MLDVDISVVVPFSDDEELVGRLARRVAAHLRGLARRFEIVAVDEGAGDNSVALLGLLQHTDVPELVLCAAEPGRGFAAGAALATGRLVWLLDAAHADASLAPIAWACERLASGVADVVLIDGGYALARRTRAAGAIAVAHGRGLRFARRLRRRVRRAGLLLDEVAAAHVAPPLAARAALWSRVREMYARR